MTAATGRRQFGFGLFTLAMIAVFIGLGVWQLQRRVEKHALIAALTERLAVEPVPLPPQSEWNKLTAQKDEFRRVHFKATYGAGPDAMVYSSGSAIRDDVSGPGTWAFVPAHLSDGDIIVVNVGFVRNAMQDREQQDRAVTRLITGEAADLVGYIRFPESAGLLTPSSGDGASARLGQRRQEDCAVLYRPRAAGAAKRDSEAWAASRASEGRSYAIRDHVVRARGGGGDRVLRLVARKT
jgi:cytochrome oxidase assembly protein ShyY1